MNQLVELHIDGMHCAHCTQTVQKTLENLGVTDIAIDLSNSCALFNPHQQSVERVISSLTEAGYPARKAAEQASPALTHQFSLEIKLAIALILTTPLLAHMVLPLAILHHPTTQLILATPVVLIGIQHFGKSALKALRQSIANMDLLIFIGIVSAYGYSLYGLYAGLGENFLFYETAASITLFVLFGNYLERRSMKRTSAAVEQLARLQPDTANRYNASGTLEKIPSTQVKNGDLLLVRNGERVPVDCSITEGAVLVDESFVTGESAPVSKQTGDTLIGGAVINDGSAKVKASAVGDETVLSQIIRLVRTATSQKPAIQQLGDKVSGVFVPIVLIIALFTVVGGYLLFGLSFEQSLLQGIAVLVISCPCAMGLATPTAVTVGIGRATQEGALIKGGAALERLAHIDTVIFDKTGTLTTGELNIERIETKGSNRDELLQIIKSIELHSTHPLAQTILQALSTVEALQLKELVEEKGLGVRAKTYSEDSYKLGSARYTGQHETDGDIFLTKNGQLAAALSVSDVLKPEALTIVSELKQSGMRVVIISGDRQRKVAAAAQALGIQDYYAEQLPEQKLALTKELSQNHRASFIGDGINDAPALAQASVGISLSGATQIAIQSAEVILLDGQLSRLPKLFSLARVTFKTIKENLFWAFFYNSMAIPLAAFGFLTPLVAALAMAFSDVIVIGNSLRLKVREL